MIKVNQTMQTLKNYKSILFIATLLVSVSSAAMSLNEAPVIRGPGVEQDRLEAYAAAEGRTTLSEQLDALRPAKEDSNNLRRLIEHAQTAWLSGNIDAGRAGFKEITNLTTSADWRESQREVIFYAYLRLSQSALSPLESEEWAEKAVRAFPDLKADASLFPPPVLKRVQEAHARQDALSRDISLAEHFPEYQIVLVNGKRYRLKNSAKIRIAPGTFRITALSDSRAPISEKMTASQLEVFHLSMPALANGNCLSPQINDISESANLFGAGSSEALTVLYPDHCSRTRNQNTGWLDANPEVAEMQLRNLSPLSQFASTSAHPSAEGSLRFPSAPESSEPLITKRGWIWIGVTTLALGAAYAIINHQQNESATTSAAQIEPSHKSGF